jgi:hypothetical protein
MTLQRSFSWWLQQPRDERADAVTSVAARLTIDGSIGSRLMATRRVEWEEGRKFSPNIRWR